MRTIDTAERRRRLVTRHFLARAAPSLEQCAGDLVGLHSSDPATVYLSGRARIADFHPSDLERALYEARSLVRMLGMRRTLFVVPRDVAALMQAACTSTYAASERKRLVKLLEDQDIARDGDRWLDRVMSDTLAALQDLGTATATQLREVVPELKRKLTFGVGKKWGGEVGVSTRVMFLLATQGSVLRGRPNGSWISSQYEWALVETWLGAPLPRLDRDEAQGELARRWLRAFGPGTMSDLKWWTGWTVKATRAALAAIEAVEVALEEGTGFVLPDDLESTPPIDRPVALLPALDATVMGWKDRDWYLGEHAAQLFDRNGNAGPTVWADGRIVGAWGQSPSGEVRVTLLETVRKSQRAAIDRLAVDLAEWLGDVRITPRFRTPVEKDIAQGG